MPTCVRCGRRVLFSGYRDDAGRYCSIHCYASNPALAFCLDCEDATTGHAVGGTFTFNGIGTIFAGAKGRCAKCHSVIQGKYIALLYVPVLPLGRHRVLYQPRPSFTSPIRFAAQPLTSEAAINAANLPSERGALTPFRRYVILFAVLCVGAVWQYVENLQTRTAVREEALHACSGNIPCETAVREHFDSCFGAVSHGPFSPDPIDKAALAQCINTKAGAPLLTASSKR
jgi:hypothetical protein